MNPSFYRRDGTNPEMDSTLVSLLLVSLVFMQFVAAADQINSTATVGDTVILPCEDPHKGEIIVVEWSRTDLELEYVLRYRDNQLDPGAQHPSYKNRADLLVGQMKVGDASLILRNTTTDDSGTYECRQVQTGSDEKLISTISLKVSPPPEPFPVWAKVLLVLLVLALVAAPVLIFWLWFRFSVQQVEVESGVESVLLPWRLGDQLVSFRSTARLPGDVRVEWRDEYNKKVHVSHKGSDCSDEQNQRYKNRTTMDKNLSLTLKRPTCEDNGFYTCRVYRGGKVLMEKEVKLKVKVHQVEVESGVKSVLLPCRTTESLDGDVRVEWRDEKYDDVVHVYQDGSDQPDDQHLSYKGRTRIDGNLKETKDLSLTLMDPTYSDTFTCRVYRGGTVLMMKQVQLEVKDQQVEFDEGAESVKLEFKVTSDLLRGDGVKLWWWDNEERIVHMDQNDSDSVYQAKFYKDRTSMNKDALDTGDLSLTLKDPTDGDSRWFRCGVYRNGDLLRLKSIQLNIKAKRNQDQPEDIRTSRNSIDPTPLMVDQSDHL